MRMAFAVACLSAIASLSVRDAAAQSAQDRPWEIETVPIVIDPYAPNAIDWDKAVTDPRLKAVVHQASNGLKTDPKFIARAKEARQHGLLWGAYHLGRPGDPIKQAELFLDLARATDARFLALDIEDDDPAKFMSLKDCQTFLTYVHEKTGRYPAVYVNANVYGRISERFDGASAFARSPLWIARFRSRLGLTKSRVWSDYTLWQFSSEINCSPTKTCLYRVPGTAYDMDVNVFNGTEAALKALFQ